MKKLEHLKQKIADANIEAAEEVINEVLEEAKQTIKKSVLARRKKYAETEVVASELGMTLEEVREFNAYSDGYNARGLSLQAELFGKPVPEEPLEEVTDVVEPPKKAEVEVPVTKTEVSEPATPEAN
jgi:hypothetical protein